MRKLLFFCMYYLFSINNFAQPGFNGLDMNMGNLHMLSNAESRSISPENFTGEKGKGGMAKLEDKDIRNRANGHSAAHDFRMEGYPVYLDTTRRNFFNG